jgi:hypothetical protein
MDNITMLVQFVYTLLLPVISSFDPKTNQWIRSSRLNKPKGVLNYIVNHLKDLDDAIITQKIQKLETQEDKIYAIISDNITDLDKKIQIISLMDGPFESIPEEVCGVCKKVECLDVDFCEKKKTNWMGI